VLFAAGAVQQFQTPKAAANWEGKTLLLEYSGIASGAPPEQNLP